MGGSISKGNSESNSDWNGKSRNSYSRSKSKSNGNKHVIIATAKQNSNSKTIHTRTTNDNSKTPTPQVIIAATNNTNSTINTNKNSQRQQQQMASSPPTTATTAAATILSAEVPFGKSARELLAGDFCGVAVVTIVAFVAVVAAVALVICIRPLWLTFQLLRLISDDQHLLYLRVQTATTQSYSITPSGVHEFCCRCYPRSGRLPFWHSEGDVRPPRPFGEISIPETGTKLVK